MHSAHGSSSLQLEASVELAASAPVLKPEWAVLHIARPDLLLQLCEEACTRLNGSTGPCCLPSSPVAPSSTSPSTCAAAATPAAPRTSTSAFSVCASCVLEVATLSQQPVEVAVPPCISSVVSPVLPPSSRAYPTASRHTEYILAARATGVTPAAPYSS